MKNSYPMLLLVSLLASCVSGSAFAEDIDCCGKLRNDNLDAIVQSVAFSPDGSVLASAYNVVEGKSPFISKKSGQGGTTKGYVVLWDVAKRKKIDTITCGGEVRHLTFSADGKLLAVAHFSELGKQKVRLLDTATWKERFSLSVMEGQGVLRWVSAMAFSPDGKKLIVGLLGPPEGADIMILDAESGKQTNILKGGEATISSLSFSADGKLMTSISEDVVQVWDMSTEKERNRFPVGRGHLAVMSPDGSTIAVSTTGSRNYSGKVALTLHDAQTGKEKIDFNCLTIATTILFTPDGKKVICGCNGFIIMYDVATGKRVLTTDGPNFTSMAITSKANLLATGNWTGTVWLWEIRAEK